MNKAISDRIRNSKKYKDIRESLYEQLRANGTDTAFFRDLVEDYMSFWVAKQLTEIDIRTNGTVITYNNGGGQTGTKENPAMAYKIKLNNQMIKILEKLQLTVENTASGGESFDGL